MYRFDSSEIEGLGFRVFQGKHEPYEHADSRQPLGSASRYFPNHRRRNKAQRRLGLTLPPHPTILLLSGTIA